MDLPSLNALLRVNGLTKESAPENISDVLLRSGYSQDEIAEAQAILHGASPTPAIQVPGVYVEKMIAKTRIISHFDEEGSIFAGRIGVKQFWLGMLLAVGVYALMFILVEITALPLYSIISGISLLSPPDLATAPIRALLLFGIGVAMLVLPALFMLTISIGLQVRRCHDFSLSGATWFMAMAALVVGAYLLAHLTPLALLSVPLAVVLWIGFMSWPGTSGENFEGSQTPYASMWGALYGSHSESGCLQVFVKKFLLTLAYLELLGIVMDVSIHSLVPKFHLPNV